jgi:hypothetical protein
MDNEMKTMFTEIREENKVHTKKEMSGSEKGEWEIRK